MPSKPIDPLVRLHRRGDDVTAVHLEAAATFRGIWAEAQAGDAGAKTALVRVVGAIGRAGWPLLNHVVIKGGDIAAWCRARKAGGEVVDAPKELGKLLFVLGRLVELAGPKRV